MFVALSTLVDQTHILCPLYLLCVCVCARVCVCKGVGRGRVMGVRKKCKCIFLIQSVFGNNIISLILIHSFYNFPASNCLSSQVLLCKFVFVLPIPPTPPPPSPHSNLVWPSSAGQPSYDFLILFN